jgi:cysteinyl-tRNA synthetase
MSSPVSDTENQIDAEDIRIAKSLEETKKNGKKRWEKAVKISAEMRTAKRIMKEEQLAKQKAIEEMADRLKAMEHDLILKEQAKKMRKLAKQTKKIEEEDSEPEPEPQPEPIKKSKPIKIPKKKPKAPEPDSDTEEDIPVEKVYKKEIVKRQVENRVDKLRDELIQKYMNGLFPKY